MTERVKELRDTIRPHGDEPGRTVPAGSGTASGVRHQAERGSKPLTGPSRKADKAWRKRESARRIREELTPRTHVRIPALEYFSDEYRALPPDVDPEQTGPESAAIKSVIAGGCNGWKKPPTSRDVYAAMQARQPTPREVCCTDVVTREASVGELMQAYREQAFTWRQVARGLAAAGGRPARRAALVAAFAKRERQP